MIEHSHENHAWVRFLSSGDSSRFFLGGTLALIFPSFLTDFSWHASSYFSSFWLIFHWLQEAFPRRWLKSGSGKNPSSQRLSHSCTLELIIRYRLKVIEDILCSFHTFALSKEPFIPMLLSARAAPWKTYLGFSPVGFLECGTDGKKLLDLNASESKGVSDDVGKLGEKQEVAVSKNRCSTCKWRSKCCCNE